MAANQGQSPKHHGHDVVVPAQKADAFHRQLLILRDVRKRVTKSIREQRESLEELELALKETRELFEPLFIGKSTLIRKRRRKK